MVKIVNAVLKRSLGFTLLVLLLLCICNKIFIGIVIENMMIILRVFLIVFALLFIVCSFLRHRNPKNIAWHKFFEMVLWWAQLAFEMAVAFAVYDVFKTFLSPTLTNLRFFNEYKAACCFMGIWAAVDNRAISCFKSSIISFVLTPIVSFFLIRFFKKNQPEAEKKAAAVDWKMEFLFQSPIEGNKAKEEEALRSLTLKQKLNVGAAVGILVLLAWSTFGEPFGATHIKRGDTLYAKEKYDEAIAEYDKVLKTDSNDAKIYIKRGNAYKKRGLNSKAIADYSKAIEIDPDNAKVYMSRGEAYKKSNEYDKAIADYSKAIEIDPKNIEAYMERGNLYEHEKKYDNVIADYGKVIELDPQAVEAYLKRASIYIDRKNYEGALADSNKALEINPESAKAYSIRGRVRKAQGDYGNAIADFTQAMQFVSSDATSYYYYERGDICRLLVDRENAVVNAMKTKSPASTLSEYGDRCYKNKNYAEAIFYYTKSIEQKDGVDVRRHRGDACRFAGDFAQALVDYTKAINGMEDYIESSFEKGKKYPNYSKADVYFGRGYIYQEQRDLVNAIENYTKAIELNPFGGAYNNRGNCYSNQGDVAQAIADYTKAIELEPNDAMYYNNRGIAHRKLGNIAQAEADFAKARELEAQ